MRRFRLAFCLFFSLLFLPVGGIAEAGSLSGSLDWHYGDFEAESNGERLSEVNSFAQKYSILYQTRGFIGDRRFGRYDLGLGAEWLSVDSEINDDDRTVTASKALFRGDVLIAPGGLPFRFHLYSQDLAPTYFSGRTDAQVLERAEVFSGIHNGYHVRTGANLTVGIRNGSYLGQYRDVLATLPKLYVDYYQDDVRDLKSDTPLHYRTRELAFVSLNKINNWAHYRFFEYEDFLDSDEDYTQSIVQLGTIDHKLQRQWINLVNWLKVSVDGSYIVTDSEGGNPLYDNSKRYLLNTFAVGRRQHWQGSTFATFDRERFAEKLEQELEIPFFASGEPNRNLAWRAQLIGDKKTSETLLQEEQEEGIFASMRVDAGRQRRYILAPELAVERRVEEIGDGVAGRAGFEVFSNRAHRPPLYLFASYHLALFDGQLDEEGEVDYLEHEIIGRADWQRGRYRTGLEEQVIIGRGEYSDALFYRIGTALPGDDRDLDPQESDNVYTRTLWYVEHAGRNRLDQRLELAYETFSTDEDDSNGFTAEHRLSFYRPTYSVRWINRYFRGDDPDVTNSGPSAIGEAPTGSMGDYYFLTEGRLAYTPSRVYNASLGGTIIETEAYSQWRLDQNFLYNIFTGRGYIRRLASFREAAEYKKWENGAIDSSEFRFSLIGDYYPLSYLFMGGSVTYEAESQGDEDTDTWIYSLSTGLRFSRLQVALSYSKGMRNGDSALADRDEQLIECRVSKTF